MIETRLNDEQLNFFIEMAIKTSVNDWNASTSYSNIALIEIQLRLLDKH